MSSGSKRTPVETKYLPILGLLGNPDPACLAISAAEASERDSLLESLLCCQLGN